MDGTTAKSKAQRAANSEYLDKLARVGLLVYGVLHFVIGVIAFQLAWGGGGGQADQSGAMSTLADNGFGLALLWVGAAGFAALTFWCLSEAILGSRKPDGSRDVGDTLKFLGKAGLFIVLGFLAVRFAVGAGGGGNEEEGATATLLGLPGGRFIVGGLGVAIAVIGIYHVYKGVSRSFMDDLDGGASDGTTGTAIVTLGMIGYIAKGIAIAVVGVLFVAASVQHDPDEAGGLDEALKTLQDQPFGPWLLTIIAVGLAAFGVYLVGRARYQRL